MRAESHYLEVLFQIFHEALFEKVVFQSWVERALKFVIFKEYEFPHRVFPHYQETDNWLGENYKREDVAHETCLLPLFGVSKVDQHVEHYAIGVITQIEWSDDVIPQYLLLELSELFSNLSFIPPFNGEGDACNDHKQGKPS